MKLACGLTLLTLGVGHATAAGSDAVDPAAVSSSDQTAPRIATTVLTAPDDGGGAYEPSLAIDPVDPMRVTVAAMHGIPRGRGGKNIWVWRTADGGRSWTGEPMRLPQAGNKPPTWAADPVVGVAQDGYTLLASMAGTIAPRDEGLNGGIFVTRRASGIGGYVPAVKVMADRSAGPAGLALAHDKPWMIVDRSEASPHRGTVYVTTASLEIEKLPRRWGVEPAKIAGSQLLFATSRDDGRTFSVPRVVASSAFGAHLAVGRTGSLEVVYQSWAAPKTLLHLRSTDSGASFEKAVPIVIEHEKPLGLPTVATRPNGDVLTCWSEGTIRCALRRAGHAWNAPGQPRVAVPSNVQPGWPMLVGTDRAWYLLLYLSDSAQTEVALFRSTGETDFTGLATLAKHPGLTTQLLYGDRRTRDDMFAVGDYVGLSASGGRIAAAYVMPRPGQPLIGSEAIYASVLTEPGLPASNSVAVR